ncbi:MAG: osmotically inducible protein OsmC [bacterium]|nr:osmotically inducible protein OsmC [bacterium]
MEMRIGFPGGERVEAEYGSFTIRTDQPAHKGGEGTAPAPFDYFLASIGTCAGFYVHKFLRQRDLPTQGVHVVLRTTKDTERRMIEQIDLDIVVPDDFPEKYEKAIVRAVDQCTVKRHILTPPRFSTTVNRPARQIAS